MASGKVGRRLPALRPAQHPPSESTCRRGSALGTWEVVEAAVFWARPAAVRNEGTPSHHGDSGGPCGQEGYGGRVGRWGGPGRGSGEP